MNKKDLIEKVKEIREKNGDIVPKKDIEADVNAVLEAITGALESGDKVCIVGFGTLEPRERAERKGHTPNTKQDIIIPAQMTAVFHPGKTLKNKLQVLLGKGF